MTPIRVNDPADVRVLVTGASGFVGRSLVDRLLAEGFDVALAQRSLGAANIPGARSVMIGEIGPSTNWLPAIEDRNVVIHLAGQVPAKGVTSDKMTTVNDLGTAQLASQCREAGVARLIALSSILAVSGNQSDIVLDDMVTPSPDALYGMSKLAAESHVEEFARLGGVGISLRPPLVYAPHAKGNWAMLLRLAASGAPLPFASVRNRRSLISLGNLIDAIVGCVKTPVPASGAYCVAEAPAVSLAQIIDSLRRGMSLRPQLFAVKPVYLDKLLRIAGKAGMAQSLLGNLEVSSARFNSLFEWSPAHSTVEGLVACGRDFQHLPAAKLM